MIVENIFKAIFALYKASPLRSKVTGFYFAQAPANATGDYVVVSPVTMRQEYDMSSRLEDMVIQFRIHTTDAESNAGPTRAIQLGESLMAVFDDCSLSITGGTLVRIDRETHNLIPEPEGGWMYQIDYRLLAQED